jgi:hypothetical protein
MQISKIVIVCAAAFIATGCRKNSLMLPSVPPLITHGAYSEKSKYTEPDDYKHDRDRYKAAVEKSPPDEATAQQARNEIANGLRRIVDLQYGEFRGRLLAGHGAIAVAGDATVLGLTAAASIAHLAATKGIYAALASGVTGINLSIDKNYFEQQTYGALAVAMDTARTAIWQQISAGLAKSATSYPLNAVEADLVEYLFAGSLPGGFAEIQKQVGAAKNAQGPAAGGTVSSSLKLTPASLSFPATKVGAPSAAQEITVQNSGIIAINISVSMVGANKGDFAEDASVCGSSIAANATCKIQVTFKPTATGAREGSVTVSASGGGAPQTVGLTGTGTP